MVPYLALACCSRQAHGLSKPGLETDSDGAAAPTCTAPIFFIENSDETIGFAVQLKAAAVEWAES